jgi:hypothetical protein
MFIKHESRLLIVMAALTGAVATTGCGEFEAELEGATTEVRSPLLGAPCGAEGGCMDCFETRCDADGDTYADETCSFKAGYRDADKKACPSGYLMETEPISCDKAVPTAMKHARPWVLSGPVINTLRDRHPHTQELANGLDDDCDNFIDETTADYAVAIQGAGLGDMRVDYRLQINDPKLRTNADTINLQVYRVRDLADFQDVNWRLPGGFAIDNKSGGPCSEVMVPYAGTATATGKANPCAGDTEGVYVVVPSFKKKILVPTGSPAGTITVYADMRCWTDAGGPTGSSCDDKHRVYNDVMFQAESAASGVSRTRALVVNQALREYHRSEKLGLVGFQAVGGRPYPHGTAYGADIGEMWCSEFVNTNYLVSMTNYPGTNTSVQRFISYFGSNFLADASGRTAIDDGRAKFGDYLAMNTHDENGAKNHSGIFLGHNYEADLVWRVAGNESNQVKISTGARNYRHLVNGNYYFAGLGRLTSQAPRY